jgi:hypothetical protein
MRRFAKRSSSTGADDAKAKDGSDEDLESRRSRHDENDRNVSALCNRNAPSSPPARLPPEHVVPVNNLSDRQYCCVWSVEVLEGGWRPDVARAMLAAVARHVNPVLRRRGWRVKRLMESCSRSWIGCCTTNGRSDADAASVNIQLNLRRRPDRTCRQFRTFGQVLAVMLHEVAHTSVGLEDIHPPAFWELLKEISAQYRSLLIEGEVALETDPYGCNDAVIVNGVPQRIDAAALQIDREQGPGLGWALRVPSARPSPMLVSGAESGESDSRFALTEGDGVQSCGASRRRNRRFLKRRAVTKPRKAPPMLKGAKMVDGRTRDGKRAVQAKKNLAPRQLAARAALQRLGGATQVVVAPRAASSAAEVELSAGRQDDSDDEPEDDRDDDSLTRSEFDRDEEIELSSDEETIAPHSSECTCRSCTWDKMLCQSVPSLQPALQSSSDERKVAVPFIVQHLPV